MEKKGLGGKRRVGLSVIYEFLSKGGVKKEGYLGEGRLEMVLI